MERLFTEHRWANGESSDYTLPGDNFGIIGKPGLSDGVVLKMYVKREIAKAIRELEDKRLARENDY